MSRQARTSTGPDNVRGMDLEVGGQPAGLRSRTKSLGYVLVRRERSHGWDHCGAIEDNQWRDHFGSVCGGRPGGGRGEIRRRPGGRWTGGRTKGGRGRERGETQDSDVPSRRISSLTLLSNKWGCHLRRPPTQGERERVAFFF